MEASSDFSWEYLRQTTGEWKSFSPEISLAIELATLKHPRAIVRNHSGRPASFLPGGDPKKIPLIHIHSGSGTLDPSGDIGVDVSKAPFQLRAAVHQDGGHPPRVVRRVPACADYLMSFQTERELHQAAIIISLKTRIHHYDALLEQAAKTAPAEPSSTTTSTTSTSNPIPIAARGGDAERGGRQSPPIREHSPTVDDRDLLRHDFKGKKKGKGVRFGNVHVREVLSKVEVEAGRERLRLDWTVLGDTAYRLNSFENRREMEGRVNRQGLGNELADKVLKGRGARAINRRKSLGTDVPMVEDDSALGSGDGHDAVTTLDQWYPMQSKIAPADPHSESCFRLGIEGRPILSSPIQHCSGRIVVTQNGSRYYLGPLSSRLEEALTILGIEFSEDEPLSNCIPMTYATNLLFEPTILGKARNSIVLLHELQAALGFPNLTGGLFSELFDILGRLGVVDRLLW